MAQSQVSCKRLAGQIDLNSGLSARLEARDTQDAQEVPPVSPIDSRDDIILQDKAWVGDSPTDKATWKDLNELSKTVGTAKCAARLGERSKAHDSPAYADL